MREYGRILAGCRAGPTMPELDETSMDVAEHVFDDGESAAYCGEAERIAKQEQEEGTGPAINDGPALGNDADGKRDVTGLSRNRQGGLAEPVMSQSSVQSK